VPDAQNNSPTRVALIGCGRWGRNIARALNRLSALEIIVDPSDATTVFAAELGVACTSDLQATLDRDDISAVAIAAPASEHARLIQAALARGKHVFVEKPLALTLEDADACARAAATAGKVLMVGHLLQYHPAFIKLTGLVDEGRIGPVRHITSHRLNPGAIRTEENALWSLAPHDFSMILGLAKRRPAHVHTTAVEIVSKDIADQYAVTMDFGEGVSAQLYCSWLSPFKEHKLTVLGEKGCLVFEDKAKDPERQLVLYADHVEHGVDGPRYRKTDGEAVAFPADEPLLAEMRCFLEAVEGRAASRTTVEEAIPVLELLTRADQSARTGGSV